MEAVRRVVLSIVSGVEETRLGLVVAITRDAEGTDALNS